MWLKAATAMGSALPDPQADEALPDSPLPSIRISNKPAPGQRGPKGLAPRTTYSRVNTGTPPIPDAGVSSQKSAVPRGMEFLPPKLAHEDNMTTMKARPTIQDMMKAAMEGTIEKIDISREAHRQLYGMDAEPVEKTASADETVPTEQLLKLADAVEFIAAKLAADSNTPGEGPGSLTVTKASDHSPLPDANQTGHARHQIPMNPPTQADKNTGAKSHTGLQTDDDKTYPKQDINKIGSALVTGNLARLGLAKKASPIALIRKLAADAYENSGGNPGSKGNTAPPATAAGEGVPPQPKGPTGLVGSNEAAMNYKRQQAKTPMVKSDMDKYLTEPALSAAADSTLNKVLNHTGQASSKISSDMRGQAIKVAAARTLLTKLAAEVCKDKKKASALGNLPSDSSGFQASTVGQTPAA